MNFKNQSKLENFGILDITPRSKKTRKEKIKEDIEFQLFVQENIVIPKFYNKIWGDLMVISSDMMKNNILAEILDYFAATDKILLDKARNQIFYLGQRIQRKVYAYKKSITIRDKRLYPNTDKKYDSELFKITEALNNDSVHSHFICHCYANGNNIGDTTDLIYGMIVTTKGLFDFLLNHPEFVKNSNAREYGLIQTFKFIDFKDIRKVSPDIIIGEYYKGKIIKTALLDSF